jgi:hypothetical protein
MYYSASSLAITFAFICLIFKAVMHDYYAKECSFGNVDLI